MLKKVYAEIGNICNLNCDFCPGTKRKKEFMPSSDFALIAPKIKSVSDYVYLHVMGEPLMHPELDKILDICRQNRLRVSLTTNGTLLKKQERLLLFSPALYRVSVSVHSFEANNQDGEINDYLGNIVDFAKKASEKGIIISLRLWNLDGENTHGHNELNGGISDYLFDSFPGYEQSRSGYKLSDKIYIELAEKFDWPNADSDKLDSSRFCYALREQIAVLCDGTVVPCCLDSDGNINLGNIFDSTFEEILSSDRAKRIYDGFSRRTAVEELCMRCPYSGRFNK